jgi:hypothetical protein
MKSVEGRLKLSAYFQCRAKVFGSLVNEFFNCSTSTSKGQRTLNWFHRFTEWKSLDPIIVFDVLIEFPLPPSLDVLLSHQRLFSLRSRKSKMHVFTSDYFIKIILGNFSLFVYRFGTGKEPQSSWDRTGKGLSSKPNNAESWCTCLSYDLSQLNCRGEWDIDDHIGQRQNPQFKSFCLSCSWVDTVNILKH